eukprot:scaffold202776_cov30-Attheya_sp.AAC.1
MPFRELVANRSLRKSYMYECDIGTIIRSEDNVESSSPPPCSYELLHKAFRHRSDQTKKQSDEDKVTTEQDCWRPEEEVLQIPVDAILNRHDMDGIGAGSKGGVYQAIIQLDYATTTMSGNDH